MNLHSAPQNNSENLQHELLQSGAATQVLPLAQVWKEGLLFHCFNRYPQRIDQPKIDRIESVLEKGLLSPLACNDNSVQRDFIVSVSGLTVPYDSYVFIHQYSLQQDSWVYAIAHRDRCFVILNSELPVINQETMCEREPNWVVTCADEVYVPMSVSIDQIIGIGVSAQILPEVISLYGERIQRRGIQLYSFDA